MSIVLKTETKRLQLLRAEFTGKIGRPFVTLAQQDFEQLLSDSEHAHQLHALINNPHTAEFLEATRIEAAHQRDRWGEAHDRGKSAENWFWLVGYLAGKCLRAVITGDREKALHHTISSAAALANWFEAIRKDVTSAGIGQDNDIKPVEIARFEGHDSPGGMVLPVVTLGPDLYSGR